MHLLRDIHLIILCAVLTLTVGCTNNGSHSFGRGGKSGEASKLQGRTADALDYLQRAYVIRDSLDRRNQRDQLAELATVYHLQEEQLARKEKEAEAERSHIINIALVIGLIAAIAFALYFFYKRRETARKNRVLAREIADAIKYKLYLNPQLDRQMLVDRLGLSKERIGAAFSKGSPYKSLIDFLTDCRLPHAAKLLTERPDLSIADVARESGFPTADTFSRNFRQKYTLTPTQFREQQATSE